MHTHLNKLLFALVVSKSSTLLIASEVTKFIYRRASGEEMSLPGCLPRSVER